MNAPESSPNRLPSSEPLGQRTLHELLEQFSERIFIHGDRREGNPKIKAPQEIYYDFGKKSTQMILDRIATDGDTRVTEAYAVFEYESEEAAQDPRECHDPTVTIAIDKLLLSSPMNNPIVQNTWYTLSSDRQGRIQADYDFQFVQGGRPVLDLPKGMRPEDRIAYAGRQQDAQRRALFRDDDVLLRALLRTISP